VKESEARHPSRSRAAIRLLAINLALLAAALTGAELLLRARAVPSSVRYSVYPANQIVTVTVDPNVTPGVVDDALFEINAVGTRGPLPSAADRIRIVTIGGSTTECFVLSLEESWPDLLGRALSRDSGTRVWVGNIAHAGRTSRQHYFDAKYVVPQLGKVDFAILLVGVNDLFNRMIQGRGFDPADVEALDAGGSYVREALQIDDTREAGWRSLQLVARGRRLLEAARLLSPAARQVQRLLSHTLPEYYVTSREERAERQETIDALPPMEAPLAEFDRNISAIVRLLEERGTRPVLVTQPALWRPDLTERETSLLWLGSAEGWPPTRPGGPYYSVRAMMEMLGMYNDALRHLAARDGIELVDLAKLVPSDLLTFYDDVHFNESGSRRVADAFARHFEERGLVTASR